MPPHPPPPPPPPSPIRYRSEDEDSGRWTGFPYRPDDIVISTRSKSGTTWTQMICALLIFQRPDLPAPLPALSPWLDWLVEPREQVLARLAAQRHRRFIKTHTPLDGIPLDPSVTYLVVARHPLDAAISLYHQGANLDRGRLRELLERTATGERPAPGPAADTGDTGDTAGEPATRPDPRTWLLEWIDRDTDPRENLDSLPGVMHHLTDAWRRRTSGNVVLLHYDDLRADLAGQMRTLAARLGIAVPEPAWPHLVEAATFTRMRSRADALAPAPAGVFRQASAFFRQGGSGAGRELLRPEELARYRTRCARLAPPDLLTWLHREP